MASFFKTSLVFKAEDLRSSVPALRCHNASLRSGRVLAMAAKANRICPSVAPHYLRTLGVSPGASRQDIKNAYRKLALQYHPDVCKDEHCSAKFTQINQAYEVVMNAKELHYMEDLDSGKHTDASMEVNDDPREDWEEWMGWEGAGIRDYSSHINYSF